MRVGPQRRPLEGEAPVRVGLRASERLEPGDVALAEGGDRRRSGGGRGGSAAAFGAAASGGDAQAKPRRTSAAVSCAKVSASVPAASASDRPTVFQSASGGGEAGASALLGCLRPGSWPGHSRLGHLRPPVAALSIRASPRRISVPTSWARVSAGRGGGARWATPALFGALVRYNGAATMTAAADAARATQVAGSQILMRSILCGEDGATLLTKG